MALPQTSRTDSNVQRLAQARANQVTTEAAQQTRAARTVDDHATDQQDREMLMAMLGLEDGQANKGRARYLGPLN
nr:hypothetical protein [Kibdelosporangium sp. MJ126-NF4]